MLQIMEIWRKNKIWNKNPVKICRKSSFFDAMWYLDSYPDVKISGMDPVLHYIQFGAAERRDPGPNFSTTLYMLEHPELEQNGINPLVHFVLSGKKSPNMNNNYQTWVKLYDTLTAKDKKYIQRKLKTLEYKPLISVIMPVYNTPKKWLKLAIDSILKQYYPYWELCIADDASTEPHIKKMLQAYAAEDPRIKVVYRKTNGFISEASNSALDLATGDFIALVDHDDELREHALYKVAEELNLYPDTVLIYSDEDKINEERVRTEPYFKSDWNPELFYSHNFINHLGVYKRSLVQEVGAFRKGYEGSQDYDLALRIIERAQSHQIRHIPHILYHWRTLPKSISNTQMNACTDLARQAIQGHLERKKVEGVRVVQNPFLPIYHRVIYPLPQEAPLVSIIIPTKDKPEVLRCCIDSILSKTDYPHFELIIIDNNSTQQETFDYFEQLRQQPNIKIIPYNIPFNYSKINNFAVKQSKGEVLVFLNNDTEVISPEWLREMVCHGIQPEIGIVGVKLYYPNNTIQHAGVVCGFGSVAGHIFCRWPRELLGYMAKNVLSQNFLAVTGACMAMRRSVFEELGGFEEHILKVAFNDVDICLRAYKRGYRILWTPYAELYHHESLTRGRPKTSEEKAQEEKEINYMVDTWGSLLQKDPYYNPNLSLTCTHYSLAFPPRSSWR